MKVVAEGKNVSITIVTRWQNVNVVMFVFVFVNVMNVINCNNYAINELLLLS